MGSDVPRLEDGVFYSQVSAGSLHTVLLRTDGQAVACGVNDFGQCDVPPLEDGVAYSQVSAGTNHTVLLRTDGQAVAFGRNHDGRCDVPPLEDGVAYIPDAALTGGRIQVLQLSFGRGGDGIIITGTSLAGEVLCTMTLDENDSIRPVTSRIAQAIAVPPQYLRLALPNGNLLSSMPADTRVSDLLNM